VLLLLILALLSMFGLIAVAFVVLTGQSQRSAKSIERIDLVSDPPQKLLEQAAMQIFRGSNSPASVMGAHSLLEDMYGNGSVQEVLNANATQRCGGQLLELSFSAASMPEINRRGGCVLTITGPTSSTPGYGQSTRIVGFNPTAPGYPQVLPFADGTIPATGTVFSINGVPFSGPGFGYNNATHNLDLAYNPSTGNLQAPAVGTLPVALLPNLPLSKYNATYPLVGVNSDYTAADFQHIFLAAQVANSAVVQTLPSFHRPSLCRYWANLTTANGGLNVSATDLSNFNSTTPATAQSTVANKVCNTLDATKATLLRSIMLRPMGQLNSLVNPTAPNIDHPNFTGSNPNFNPFWDGVTVGAGQWDVDNDGDGVPDSVWVDLGLPVRSTSDGRMYKPLFAILCTDLDGRLNLNAHGSLLQANGTLPGTVAPSWGTLAGNPLPTDPLPANLTQRGLGFGPAEINLGGILGANYLPLLQGNGTYEGRYGGDTNKLPGLSGGSDEKLIANKWFEYAGDNNGANCWWGFLTMPSGVGAGLYTRDSFGSPPDPFGRGAIGLDTAGRPLYMNGMGGSLVGTPYELNLGQQAPRGLSSSTVDNPFSVAELERILRPFDKDATTLPARLATLAPTLLPAAATANRLNVTTESWDLPCPNVLTPASMPPADRTNLNTAHGNDRVTHVTDLLVARGIPSTEWAKLLPPELLAGLKMDINRPFGNGRTDESDPSYPGIVDAPATPANTKVLSLLTGTTPASVPVSYDGICLPDATKTVPVGSGGVAADPLAARQLQARYLYVLMFSLADREYLRNHFGSAEGAARAVAQWAINAVDVRDRDDIMTPFDFDPNYAYDDGTHPLYNGTSSWNPPGTKRYRVWGCERPQLLIAETLAFHDRNSEDTDQDPTTHQKVADGDKDYDQVKRPEGSLFVELYNPSGPLDPPAGQSTPVAQSDSFTAAANRYVGCVRLNQTTPTGGFPVWRLAITEGGTPNVVARDPDDPVGTKPPILRTIYFTNPTAVKTAPGIGQPPYYPSNAGNIAPILPGRYAVIGPRPVTYVGTRADGNLAKTRRIVLTPDSDPNSASDQVGVFCNKYTDGNPLTGQNELPITSIKPPVAVVVDLPRQLNVSEPVNGYPAIPPIGDSPFDFTSGDPALMLNKGTTPNYKVVHLQRLADPSKPYNNNASGSVANMKAYNPYVTIDSQVIDLTVFNGNISSNTDKEPRDYQASPKVYLLDGPVMFAARQRGEKNALATDGSNNLWKQTLVPKVPTDATDNPPAPGGGNHRFDYVLRHTLGYLNDPFSGPVPAAGTIDPRDATNGWRSTRGDPTAAPDTFPWLTWNNRPYVSPLELMLVPWQRSSQLLRFYDIAQAGDPYTLALDVNNVAGHNVPFPHLPDFLQSALVSAAPGTSAQLHRVFEYLRVPSPFACAETQASPTAANSANHTFRPPFNRISNYREPGKININTIYSQDVFNGLMNSFDTKGNNQAFWTEFVQSRRGDTQPKVLDLPIATSPTEFAKPFRSFGGASLTQPAIADREINWTLLRAGPVATTQPLFQYNSANPVNNTERNPFFRYQALQRLGNLVTTRSNVYAVWVTVGYFEVEPAGAVNAIYPDGYKLSRELGSDTGEIERHRAFYIFDRTIPVSFQRGTDLNVQKAILVNRFIE
jgi:hypothetical protein